MTRSARRLPTGTVTMLFTDVEGSTRLLDEVGAPRYGEALLVHRERLRAVADAHRGVELGTEGDAFFFVFQSAADGIAAAAEMQAALADGPLRVRMGLHTGEVLIVDDDYVGMAVHTAARIASAAHGGQVVVSSQTRALAGVPLRDLGDHRLKDLAAPERLYQLGDGEFPPLRTLRHVHLPVQATPLIGRKRELAELVELAATSRVITLTGAGGSGKTRLALALAAELADGMGDGVWWVSLATVTDPNLVIPAIAAELGDIADLHAYLRDRAILFVLDNFEQVIDAADAVGRLLSAAPGCAAIVTSRERLAIAGEQEYPVPPLSPEDAAVLFTARARQVNPSFEPAAEVTAICERLDHLPLALELAAPRVKLLSQRQLLARLEQRLPLLAGGRRDLPARQATMQAAISWSYDLLDGPEQRLFMQLGVFMGSFELEAAEAVCDAGLDTLQSLIDKSLVRVGDNGRCFLLQTTREFALARLDESGTAEDVRARHARWYFALGVAAGGADPGRTEARTRLRRDASDVALALAWALDHDTAAGLRLADVIFETWLSSGRIGELVRWHERVLEHADALSVETRADAFAGLGLALEYSESLDPARAALTTALALYRELCDERNEARVLTSLGGLEFLAGSPASAVEWVEQALPIHERLGDTEGMARSLHWLGDELRDTGAFERAAELYVRSIHIRREHGLGNAMSVVHSLGDLWLDKGDLIAASRCYTDALTLGLESDDARLVAYCFAGLACVAARRDDAHTAGRLWTLAERIERDIGFRMQTAERARYERNLTPETRASVDYLDGVTAAAAQDPLAEARARACTDPA
jgi:predicted ATPase/class 3 adenylate cyclase